MSTLEPVLFDGEGEGEARGEVFGGKGAHRSQEMSKLFGTESSRKVVLVMDEGEEDGG
eukprot:CAMPEP_0184353970 /NCGR_PEP_ID=MMETSP1089-20130417/84232_1 /TAXON_ID=38269 ORGANISM="Gloeochaete wittrockiana, Strain SAG46.84" /NCGR_SAMPLE_ID=MMETSP1089 /ASSEMBLY_ACC=CAM_ASM_000445 /LENGTH=57 /DNA_ID=CAMNT_0026689713 /DNA_START=15 /DNA_END=184 /DNA_ORIENTATION=-